MIVWVLYDIKNDKARSKVAKICKHSGLYRVQYSCFLGTLSKNEKDSLQLEVEYLINDAIDKVYIFNMSKDELKSCAMLGQAFDDKLISDEIKSLFF